MGKSKNMQSNVFLKPTRLDQNQYENSPQLSDSFEKTSGLKAIAVTQPPKCLPSSNSGKRGVCMDEKLVFNLPALIVREIMSSSAGIGYFQG